MPLLDWLKQRFTKKTANLSVNAEPIFIHGSQTDLIARLQGRCERLRTVLMDDISADRRQALTIELERKGAALRRALSK